MTESSAHRTITGLLRAVEQGDRAALDMLLPLVYDQLRVLAHQERRTWRDDLTLNTTALVHEAYLKVVDQKRLPGESRAHVRRNAAHDCGGRSRHASGVDRKRRRRLCVRPGARDKGDGGRAVRGG